MSDPTLVSRHALEGVSVAFSVSDSADLQRLGLTPRHCEMAVTELARAVFIAGGRVVYGGRLRPEGYTTVLMDEASRFREGRQALVLCVPESEHQGFSIGELKRIDSQLGLTAQLILLDASGSEISLSRLEDARRQAERVVDDAAGPPIDHASPGPATGLTMMRSFVTRLCDARVLVGGALSGYAGSMPGVIEEAILCLENTLPIYVAGGFGGAAAEIARRVGLDDLAWAPPDIPVGSDAKELEDCLALLGDYRQQLPPNGLTDEELGQFAVTHRAGDIAALVVLGLARLGQATQRSLQSRS